jgi:fibronectin type 3 domain-containing protein
MKRRAGFVPLSLFLLLGLLCLSSFVCCSEPNIIPAAKIARGNVTLTWSEVSGATSYNIYFDGKAGLTRWTSHKIPNASNPITVTDLDLGTTYYFGIAVVRESGESSILSEKAYAVTDEGGSIQFGDLGSLSLNVRGQVEKEQRPEGRATRALDDVPKSQEVKNQDVKEQVVREQKPEGQTTLAWDNVPNAVSYNIYWGESPGVTKRSGKKIANATNPYTLKGLKRGKTYYFVVTAVNNSGESKESEKLSFTIKE